MNIDLQIQQDIDELRDRITDTKALYREACVILFFRYGITPTANKLYQFVRKGSMSAPAEALNKFWEDLRDKSRIRIEHPDIPEELKVAAGEMVAALWGRARTSATDQLAELRKEANEAISIAETARSSLESEITHLKQVLAAAESTDKHSRETISSLEKDLAAERGIRASLEAQIRHQEGVTRDTQAELGEARRSYNKELEAQRESIQLLEERYSAVEKRALIDIDRERTNVTRIQKELDSVRSAASISSERHREELNRLSGEIGSLRQQVGILEGQLSSISESRDSALRQTDSLRIEATGLVEQLATAKADGANWKQKAIDAEARLADLRSQATKRKQKPKSTTQNNSPKA